MSDRSSLHARVLLAVDSPTIAVFARALLQRWGLDVVASDGMTACHREKQFDLVIVEASSPGASGIVARSTAPVLALRSGRTELAGAAAYCGVPFEIDSFRATVQACLAGADTDAPDIDTDAIIELWGSLDNGGFLTVLAVFLVELCDRLAAVDALLPGGSRETLEREAHSIKGAASNVGAAAIRAGASRLEASAKTGAATEICHLAHALRIAAQRGISAFEAIIRAGRRQ